MNVTNEASGSTLIAPFRNLETRVGFVYASAPGLPSSILDIKLVNFGTTPPREIMISNGLPKVVVEYSIGQTD